MMMMMMMMMVMIVDDDDDDMRKTLRKMTRNHPIIKTQDNSCKAGHHPGTTTSTARLACRLRHYGGILCRLCTASTTRGIEEQRCCSCIENAQLRHVKLLYRDPP